MASILESSVTTNADQNLYVIHHGDHVSCLGFDVCLERTERIVIELIGRGKLPASYLECELESVKVQRGTIAAYDTYRMLSDTLRDVCSHAGESAVCGLSPQLTGLEGWRVEVVDQHGETRRFIVGRSTGWMPCHLEISRTSAHGGHPASMEYASVEQIRKVR